MSVVFESSEPKILDHDPVAVKPPTYVKVNQTFGVEWNAVSGATSYNLRQTESGNLNQTTTIYSGPNTVAQVTLVRYISDTFYYDAQACVGSQCSPWVQAPGVAGTTLTQTGKPEVAPAAGSTTQ